MSSPLIDVVIPTFNQSEMTAACARSLFLTTSPGTARVVWVDNGSAPDDRALIAAAWERTGLEILPLMLPTNLGFVKATNMGLAASVAPYALLLNNDTELPPGWVSKLTEPMMTDSAVGIAGPLSSSPHQWQGQVPKTWRGWTTLGNHQMLSFFCALIRREVLVECGYLSEEYQQGLGDDDDYCERVKRAGWKLALVMDLEVKHHHRTTFRAVHGEGGWLEYQKANIDHFKKKWNLGP